MPEDSVDPQPPVANARDLPRHTHKGGGRRCPDCDSDQWEWVESVPITPDELQQYLLAKYCCLKCGAEFLFEDRRGTRWVKTVERCAHCTSLRRLKRISRDKADIELWQCQQCLGIMGIGPPDIESGDSSLTSRPPPAKMPPDN